MKSRVVLSSFLKVLLLSHSQHSANINLHSVTISESVRTMINVSLSHLWVFPILCLYLIWILHQTTTIEACMLSKDELYLIWILHQTTTRSKVVSSAVMLYLIWILHQTTTLAICPLVMSVVVSYLDSTSNHNFTTPLKILVVLYLIWILHQTTTNYAVKDSRCRLYLIWILHQTTTVDKFYNH